MKKVAKKTIILGVLLSVLFSFCTATSVVFAENPNPNDGTDGAGVGSSSSSSSAQPPTASCRELLGMVSWDCNTLIYNVTSQDELTREVIKIAGNILSDLTVLASYLALGFVIYGGYQYMFSYGDPQKAATGKKTLTQSSIGLIITTLSTVIFSAIRIALSSNGVENMEVTVNGFTMTLADANAEVVVMSLLNWATSMGGIVAAIFLVYGGFSYITASGDASKLTKAKQSITYALVGLAVVGLAQLIMVFVKNNAEKAREEAAKQPTASYVVYEIAKGEK